MKKHLLLTLLAVLALSVPAGALEYTMEAPDSPNYGKTASIEAVDTRDNGERKNADVSKNAAAFTEVTDDLYYKGGHLGRLEIPVLDLSVKIYEGTGSSTLAKGVGHFEDTSIWGNNVCLAAHNRGANNYFGQIHTLDAGDRITLTTKLGTKTYEVTTVSKVSETDRTGLEETGESCLTLYTCVRDQRDLRYCVRAVEVM